MAASIVDIIPVNRSGETAQNSEPSLAVDPNDPTQIIAGTFGAQTPYFLTTDGGTVWSNYDSLVTDDKSLAWKADGSGFLTVTMTPTPGVANSFDFPTYSGTISSGGFGTPINTFAPDNPDFLDQPWVRTGPSNRVYVAYNNLNDSGSGLGEGKTASVNVSTDGGNTYTPVVIDRVGQVLGGPGQDAPAVRLAVNGSTVYAAFVRWERVLDSSAAGFRYVSQVVVVRSDYGGTDSFTALGAGGIGSDVAPTISPFSHTDNSSLTLGQERTGSDLAIAVAPNNANRLVVAYEDAPGVQNSGQLQLVVSESSDGGATWSTKFTTSSSTRSGEPALAILTDGTIGLLYNSYTPGGTTPDADGTLSQHLLQTADDFATTSDSVLAAESNATPVSVFDPYVGDFFDLEGLGNTFYGIFSASNADNGTNATFSNITFQRHFTGTPGTATFQLTDGSGNPVAASIDPFFFTATGIACFLRGTLIWTERGEVAVEDLAIGDEVVILSGEVRPIKWIGHRAYDGRFVAANRSVLPIRIEAGAFDDGVPARDLWVSPEHALYIRGVLVPASLLVNGATITQTQRIDWLEYFHIELDSHEVILAEGAPAESFVDCDNRFMFHNGTEFARLYPADSRPSWEFCAPRLKADSAELTAIRAALLERAEALGDRLTDDPDFRLIVDGEVVLAQAVADEVYSFAIPAGSGAIWLASRSTVPAETEASSHDRRRLGVSVKQIVLREASLRTAIGHAHPSLRQGFHAAESGHRWTDGMAQLPDELLRPFAGELTVEVHLIKPGLRYPLAAPAPGAAPMPGISRGPAGQARL